MIPPDGLCRVPDTEWNRNILKVSCYERVEVVNTIKPKTDDVVISKQTKMPATFELLSNVDLNADAPNKAETTYTEEELNAIVAKKMKEVTQKDSIDVEPIREIKAPKAKKAVKKAVKKAPKKDEVLDAEPDLV